MTLNNPGVSVLGTGPGLRNLCVSCKCGEVQERGDDSKNQGSFKFSHRPTQDGWGKTSTTLVPDP